MKIIGQGVCGPGEADRYMRQTMEEFKRLCDEVFICLCNATEKEQNLVKEYGFFYYRDDREWGKQQPNIKTDLLKRIKMRNPDWVVALDMDETLPTLTREKFEPLTEGRTSMQMYVVNLWNDEKHYKRISSFWNVRAYSPKASSETQFLRKPVHCGNAPPFFYGSAKDTYVPHIMLHRGLMDPADRAKKVERYNKYDPHAIHKGYEYYDMLSHDTGSAEYDQEAVLKKIQDYCAKL